MPAPRKPKAEEQLARTNTAKRIGPSAKTIGSLRISNNMHLPTVKDPRAECHHSTEQCRSGAANVAPNHGQATPANVEDTAGASDARGVGGGQSVGRCGGGAAGGAGGC